MPFAGDDPIPEQTLEVPPRLLIEREVEPEPPLFRGDDVERLEATATWAAGQYRPLARDYNALVCIVRDYLDGPETVAVCLGGAVAE
ncbi:hypothetical protein [Hyphobacterium sp.]|uniref:hypothetical protein n=1 Tax=Hyphobacterium sp. TaxID=2004662 RepID=UPI003B52AAE7